MTAFELKQSSTTFINAGRKAYLIIIHISDNPYKSVYHRKLWDYGFKHEKTRHEKGRDTKKKGGKWR